MKEMTMILPDYRPSKHLCPCCCEPLRVQHIGAEVVLWCPSSSCCYGDDSEGHAVSKLAAYGVQAADEDAAFEIMETRMAAMPERMAPDSPDEDAGSDR